MRRGKYLLGLLLTGLIACTSDSLVPDNGSELQKGKELEKVVFNIPDVDFDDPLLVSFLLRVVR